MVYLQLIISIVLEVVATSLMKKTDGFTNVIPTLTMLACYAGAFYFMSMSLIIIGVVIMNGFSKVSVN